MEWVFGEEFIGSLFLLFAGGDHFLEGDALDEEEIPEIGELVVGLVFLVFVLGLFLFLFDTFRFDEFG